MGTGDHLKDHFAKIGKVRRAEVYYDRSGKGPATVVGRPISKGCGVVEFENEEDAQEAIRELAETQLDGRAILVREDRDPPPAHRDGADSPPRGGGGRAGDGGERRPESGGKGSGKATIWSHNDWICPKCGDNQFARN